MIEWPEPEISAARREAGRTLAFLWLGRAVICVSIRPGERYLDRPRAPAPPTVADSPHGFTAAEADVIVHLAGYEGAFRAGWVPGRPPGVDPDFQLARDLRPHEARALVELQVLVQRHLAARSAEFYTIVFALQDRRVLSGIDVRRLVLRSRLKRPTGGR